MTAAPMTMQSYSRAGSAGNERDAFNTEAYGAFEENPFLGATTNPLSTFSIDVDRASYANVRRIIGEGRLPPKDAVRIEELLNYFTYDDALPDGDGVRARAGGSETVSARAGGGQLCGPGAAAG